MIDAAAFNQHLWSLTNALGWWFWFPFVLYGIVGLRLLYSLAPAATALGRMIRVILSMAFVSMVFIPMFNGLGAYIFHAIAVGMLLTIYQLYLGCRAAGLIRPPQGRTILERTVSQMTELPKRKTHEDHRATASPDVPECRIAHRRAHPLHHRGSG